MTDTADAGVRLYMHFMQGSVEAQTANNKLFVACLFPDLI